MISLHPSKQPNKPGVKKKLTKSQRFSFSLISFEEVYRFKITLKDIEPPIWRRIEVPASYDFYNLHCAIQDAMGWQDYHLHEFRLINPETGKMANVRFDEDEFADSESPEWVCEFEDLITKYVKADLNRTFEYEYDFGDGWVHLVELESIHPRERGVHYPCCLAGERRCPPEDCGGAHGYEELLKTLNNPKHPDHKHMKRWVGKDFDPEWFHHGEVFFSDPEPKFQRLIDKGW